eukprot:5197069-Pyramimonas_sp.AAC.1
MLRLSPPSTRRTYTRTLTSYKGCRHSPQLLLCDPSSSFVHLRPPPARLSFGFLSYALFIYYLLFACFTLPPRQQPCPCAPAPPFCLPYVYPKRLKSASKSYTNPTTSRPRRQPYRKPYRKPPRAAQPLFNRTLAPPP